MRVHDDHYRWLPCRHLVPYTRRAMRVYVAVHSTSNNSFSCYRVPKIKRSIALNERFWLRHHWCWKCRQGKTKPVKDKKDNFQPQWLTQYLWLWYEWKVMWCVYCRQCGPSIAGNSKLVVGSTQFKLETVTDNQSKKHKRDFWEQCRARVSEPEHYVIA